MQARKLKLGILCGTDSAATHLCISLLADLADVEIVGILFDSEPQSLKQRFRNLQRNVRREGLSYVWSRLGAFATDFLERCAARLVSHSEVLEVLRQSFPERAFSLAELAERHHIPIQYVGNLNSPSAAETLRKLDANVGVVLGTRILKRRTFEIPHMGCITLHRGKMPEYRGLPPGFWELYDGQNSAGASVHFVDDALGTGDIIGQDTVPIHPKDSPVTLRRKLDVCGGQLLARCAVDLAHGAAVRRPQPPSNHKSRTSPTRRQRRELAMRPNRSSEQQNQWMYAMKTLLYLTIYHTGLFHLVRYLRKARGASRACVLIYHRVNDLAEDELTTNVERFAEHMLTLRKYYSVIPTSVLVEKITSHQKISSDSAVIHFDDCYKDVYTNASRILSHVDFPACSFVCSGYVGTDRIFPHDAAESPFPLENLTPECLVALTRCGFEIGSHTVNHVDLGQCGDEVALSELTCSKEDLEEILQRPVTMFSYPFGSPQNIRPEVVELVRRAGYEAMFSAHGGNVTRQSDPFNLPRVSMSGTFRPLDQLMEIEGFSLGALKRRWLGVEKSERAHPA